MPALATYPASAHNGRGETVATGTDQDAIDIPLRFDGRDEVLYDKDTNLYWMRARNYSPTQGRFLQVDPLPPQPGTADTAYSYAGNDPVKGLSDSLCK